MLIELESTETVLQLHHPAFPPHFHWLCAYWPGELGSSTSKHTVGALRTQVLNWMLTRSSSREEDSTSLTSEYRKAHYLMITESPATHFNAIPIRPVHLQMCTLCFWMPATVLRTQWEREDRGTSNWGQYSVHFVNSVALAGFCASKKYLSVLISKVCKTLCWTQDVIQPACLPWFHFLPSPASRGCLHPMTLAPSSSEGNHRVPEYLSPDPLASFVYKDFWGYIAPTRYFR